MCIIQSLFASPGQPYRDNGRCGLSRKRSFNVVRYLIRASKLTLKYNVAIVSFALFVVDEYLSWMYTRSARVDMFPSKTLRYHLIVIPLSPTHTDTESSKETSLGFC